MDTIIANLKSMIHCGLDSSDFQIFSKPTILSTVIIGCANKVSNITYKDILDQIKTIKSTAGFDKMKEGMIRSDKLEKTEVTPSNWSYNKEFYRQMGFSDGYLDSAYALHLKYANTLRTYKQMFGQYAHDKQFQIRRSNEKERGLAIKDYSSICDTSHSIALPGNIVACDNYEIGLACSKSSNRPVLVYFSFYRCRQLPTYGR